MAAGIVGDVGVGNAVAAQFPGGEGTLVARAGFIHPDMDRNAGVMGLVHRARRRAPVHGRNPAGVAMGQDADRLSVLLARCDLADDLKTILADAVVDADIFVGNLVRELQRCGGAVGFRQREQVRTAAVERPTQVDGRRPGLVEKLPGRVQMRIGRVDLCGQCHTVGSGCTNERRAAHAHLNDGVGEVLKCVDLLDAEFVRQPALIDDLQGSLVVIPPERAVMSAVDLHGMSFLLNWRASFTSASVEP